MKIMSCITAINFSLGRMRSLMKLNNFNSWISWKNIPSLCSVWNFFENVTQTLKKMRVNSSRTDILYYCDRTFIVSNKNFNELNPFQSLHFMEKRYTDFVSCFVIYSICKICLKKVGLMQSLRPFFAKLVT